MMEVSVGLDLLLVDDDSDYAVMLREELAALDHRITVAVNGRAALAAVGDGRFDAIVLDRMMPKLDGLSFLEMLRGQDRTVPVIMLTALSSSRDKIEGLEAGADDYVVKPVVIAELNARLNAIIRGRRWNADGGDLVRVGDIVVSPSGFRAWRGGQALTLGKLELKLLAELARHADQVLTRAMLIERVWGYDFEPETNIVDVYIRRLRIKLTEGGGDDPIMTVRGVGYSLRG